MLDKGEGSGAATLVSRLRARSDEAASLRALAEVVGGTAELSTAIRDVNRLVAIPLGFRLDCCSLVSTHLRAATGAPAPRDGEAGAIEQWRIAVRHGAPATPVRVENGGGKILVPVIHRRRVHGVLRVQAEADIVEDPLLPAIGMAFGEVAWKAGVRRQLARSRRRLAIAVEQERTARDAQASLHRRLSVLGDRLAATVADAPDRVWRMRMQELLLLTGEADREVRQSLNLLRSLPAQGDDLPAALKALAREVSASTETNVKVEVTGDPRKITSGRHEALFHVAVEALLAAALSARALSAVVLLEYDPRQVRLTVRDDGVGLAHRQFFTGAGAPSKGLRGAQERLSRVAGRMRLSGMRPRGAVVEATVPCGRQSR
jgi:signal transduction histidine kinase